MPVDGLGAEPTAGSGVEPWKNKAEVITLTQQLTGGLGSKLIIIGNTLGCNSLTLE